ncbi:hypothetical protein P5Y53_04320 [Dyella jiangningensis]|uniref:hypothetical protein n=1 Tax=Dyella jiangningensis TaxID=1379159 RepID=UPI00240EBADA|nr:hypothetical protein [Dyella jiangningensis]MDG2536877.1 hypothetical protein [Dyella jiangningensis]
MLPEDPDTAIFRRVTLRDDRQVTVKAIFPEDKTILDEAFERPCEEAFYTRFLSVVRDVPREILLLCAPGPGGHAVALVAITGTGPSEAIVGGARYVTGASGGTGEFAVTVADA